MKITYDPAADALYIRLKEGEIDETEEIGPGIHADRDADGNVLGFEILQASLRTDSPTDLCFSLLKPGA